MEVAVDLDLKFELAVQLGRLEVAHEIVKESDSDTKWKQLSDLAISSCQFNLAEECLYKADDLSGLLLFYSAVGSAGGVRKLAILAAERGRNNIAFISHLLLGEIDECLQLLVRTGRVSEAAFLARTYKPRYAPNKPYRNKPEHDQSINQSITLNLASYVSYFVIVAKCPRWSSSGEPISVPSTRRLPTRSLTQPSMTTCSRTLSWYVTELGDKECTCVIVLLILLVQPVHQALKAEQLFQRKRRPATQFQAAQQEINVDLIEAAASHAGGASFAPATETASVLAAVPPSPVAAASTSPVAAAAPTSPVAVAPSSPAQVAPAATAPAADAEAPVVDDFDEEALMREVEQSTVEIGDEEASELLSKSIDELLEKDGE